jgi:hypothetical protein
MYAFRLNKGVILDYLGLAQEEADETVLSTINVRLEEMFREAARCFGNVVHVHADDLRKIAEYNDVWRAEAHALSSRELVFTRDEGLSDSLLHDLNMIPIAFAQQLGQNERLVFCHSPMFRYAQERGQFTMTIWMQIVYAPSIGDTA